MKAVTAAVMREMERRTMEITGVPTEALMDRAGFGVAEGVRRLAEANGFEDPRVSIFAGRGNNGGDAFVAARYLKQIEYDVEVLVAGSLSEVRGDALAALRKLKQAGVTPQALETVDDWEDLLAADWLGADIIVDGLLGTGASGPARGPVSGAIQVINRFSDLALVVSIDIPSGLNADTGAAEGDTVAADLTLTMGLPKPGLLRPEALEYVGTVEVVNIGIPIELIDEIDEEEAELITPADFASSLPVRRRRSHKGTYGHVLIIGGAPGYSGAVIMAAMAACRSGAGLVTVLTPADQAAIVATRVPEAMVRGGAMTETGSLADAAALTSFGAGLESFSAVLIGPGLTTHPAGDALLARILQSAIPAVVLDADALNLLAAHPALMPGGRRGVILTPHPGEMARLAGTDTATVEADRWGVARATAVRFGAVTVLKGAGTVVSDGLRLAVNLSGNPGMATGGMGDVLAGFMTGLAGQGMDPYTAACAAVHLHGCAGDDAARLGSQAGLTAIGVVEALPRVFRLVQGR
jgi:hydroxyethylthiazole kinase-like uncharacterized protein yjeF